MLGDRHCFDRERLREVLLKTRTGSPTEMTELTLRRRALG